MSVTLESLIVNQTSSVTITCEVFGIPVPTVNWTRMSAPSTSLTSTGNIHISETTMGNNITSILTIHQAQWTDMDTYTCTGINNINNLISSPEQDTLRLFVQGERNLRVTQTCHCQYC